MGKIDTEGTFIGEIVESAISTTKNGFPQWTPRLLALQKWIDNVDDMKHFGLSEPAYVDWSSFSEDAVGFLSLYGKGKDEGSEPAPTLNYEQAQLATGWDGNDFETLNTFVGTQILFRMANNTWEGKTNLQVSWIDNKDASATKTLKALDSAAIKDLNAKFLKGAAKKATVAAKPATPSKPTTKPGKPGTGQPAASATAPSAAASATPTAAASTVAASTTTPAATQTTTSPSKAPTKKVKTPPPAQPAEEKVAAGLPNETTQAEAWDYVTTHKGENEDTVVEEAWIAACNEVGADRDEDSFTGADWAKVRNIVLKDLAA